MALKKRVYGLLLQIQNRLSLPFGATEVRKPHDERIRNVETNEKRNIKYFLIYSELIVLYYMQQFTFVPEIFNLEAAHTPQRCRVHSTIVIASFFSLTTESSLILLF